MEKFSKIGLSKLPIKALKPADSQHGRYKLTSQHERGGQEVNIRRQPLLSFKTRMLYASNFAQIFNNSSSRCIYFTNRANFKNYDTSVD